MTDITPPVAAPETVLLPVHDDGETALQPCQPGFVHVMRLRTAMLLIGPVVGAVLIDQLVLKPKGLPSGFLTVAAPLLFLLFVAIAPQRRFLRIGHALLPDRLRAVDGYLFHRDTLVPFARVQHIDVTRGPLERMFGVASLVVHTAGTHNSIVTLPGLSPGDADAMRETIRHHIRADPA